MRQFTPNNTIYKSSENSTHKHQNSYKEKLDAFSTEYKRDGVRCLPRTLAENDWGGKDKLAVAISKGECWLKDLEGVEYVEWRTMSQDREGGTVRTFGVQGQRKVANPMEGVKQFKDGVKNEK